MLRQAASSLALRGLARSTGSSYVKSSNNSGAAGGSGNASILLARYMASAASTPPTNAAATPAAAPAAAPAPPPNPDVMEVFVNDVAIQVEKGSTVLQACEQAGADVPRFCYHQRLSIAGNCRMCLVEVEKAPKPVASCAMPAGPGMKIKTDTPMVKKAREGVMEFLLINHPLDCPICDQGGQCDLQDMSMVYGSDRGRFTEYKRSVVDKNLGPLVKTVMTRCIHCTRCVRFATEVAGVQDLGITGRGNAAEVGTYVEKLLTSELSGNVIDLCPVGALTSKPFAFTARPWELKATETIDVHDALGSNIRVETRGSEVMRVVPLLNEDLNEEWISDKTRFAYDGLKRQRLNAPLVKVDGHLQPATWRGALEAVVEALHQVKPTDIKAVAGKLADAESIIALKDFVNRLGGERLESEGPSMDADSRSSYLLNTTISRLEDADLLLLVGVNPRVEAPVLNARLRRAAVYGALRVGVVGEPMDLTYPSENLGTTPAALSSLLDAKSTFGAAFKKAERPMIIVGTGVYSRPDSAAVLKSVLSIADAAKVVREGWNGYNVLHTDAGKVAALDLGFVNGAKADTKAPAKFVYLLGADEEETIAAIPKEAFVVYQGHHGDRGAHRADIVLPGAAYTEKSGTFVNTEGRVQATRAAAPVVGDARDDWKIIRALSEVAGVALPYDDITEVRARLAEVSPTFAGELDPEETLWLNGDVLAAKPAGKVTDAPLKSPIANFYMTDAISRASKTMAKATTAREANKP